MHIVIDLLVYYEICICMVSMHMHEVCLCIYIYTYLHIFTGKCIKYPWKDM